MNRGEPGRLARHMQAMARNNAYANARLLEAVAALGPEGFAAERTSFFPSLRATLNHTHAVDLYYIDALEEGGLGRAAFAHAPDFADPEALREAQAACDARLIALCDGLDGPALDRRVPTDRGPESIPERVDHLLAHLFQHQIHHRGQAHAMLAGTEIKPPQLDEFLMPSEAHLRADDVRSLGWTEAALLGERGV